jgi:lipopolysaccharide export system permease protein
VIFHRSLLRELGSYAAAVFAVLFAIVITTQFVRLLARAAGGKIPADAIVALIGFTVMNYVPILLALTVFVSVLMTVSRSYRDSEMVVWSASGVSLLAWVRPVLAFAAPLVLVITLLALFLSPWANGRADDYRRRLDTREEVSRIAPGVFRESVNSERVYFVEAVEGQKGVVRNVFIASNQHGKSWVAVSREGLVDTAPNGDRYAVLLHGRRYEGVPGTAEYRVMEFDRYAQLIQATDIPTQSQSPTTIPTLDLLQSTVLDLRAELLWRVGLPLVALNLSLLAIPLAFVNPRVSRSVNFFFAVFSYFIYYNLLRIMEHWVAQGRVRFEIGWWALHAAMFGVIAFLFLWRNTLGFRLWWRR